MAKQKKDTEFNDAKGNTHKHFADGRAEIYIGGYDKSAEYAEVTDGADIAVNRKRFLLQQRVTVEETLQVRDPEEPAQEFDPLKTVQIGGPDDAIPGIDLIDENGDVVEHVDEV